jgi:hypothetical protein
MTTPNNVIHKTLYRQIKNQIDKELNSQKRRWSLYASGRLVKEYKKQGGKYRGSKPKNTGINRWFKEEWINVCKLPKHVQCGRKNVPKTYKQMKRSFPYCRPIHRISKNTPKTVDEITTKQIQKMCKKKRRVKENS